MREHVHSTIGFSPNYNQVNLSKTPYFIQCIKNLTTSSNIRGIKSLTPENKQNTAALHLCATVKFKLSNLIIYLSAANWC